MILEKSTCTRACSLRGSSILVVDDCKITTILIEKILRAAGIGDVKTATDVKGAAVLLMSSPFDLIISDYKMDRVDGLSFLKLLRGGGPPDSDAAKKLEPYKATPFILLTAYSTEDILRDALAAGAVGVIAKPIKPAVLLNRLKLALGIACTETCFSRS